MHKHFRVNVTLTLNIYDFHWCTVYWYVFCQLINCTFIDLQKHQALTSCHFTMFNQIISTKNTFLLKSYCPVAAGYHLSRWRRAAGAAGLPALETLSHRDEDQQHGVSPSVLWLHLYLAPLFLDWGQCSNTIKHIWTHFSQWCGAAALTLTHSIANEHGRRNVHI